ncbi:hypothetical protein TNCV_4333141 [Trichonephila clavipes]|nr:hypothetical protein TNCV_4333141 [Trichonephila clavipes]
MNEIRLNLQACYKTCFSAVSACTHVYAYVVEEPEAKISCSILSEKVLKPMINETSIAKAVSGSCEELECFHGAKCKEKHGEVQCVCDFKCTSEDRDTKTMEDHTVCGTDGNSYGSECQLRLFSCRYQKPIEVAGEGSCFKLNVTLSTVPVSTTMSSTRRSTETTTRKPTTVAETKIVREITDEPLENLLQTPKSALEFSTPTTGVLFQ